MLESDSLWIADTGATEHVTKFATGGVRQRESSVKMRGFNTNESAKGSVEMDIPVVYCDKDGKEVRSAELKDVQVNEGFNFNLFSVNKMLMKGYTLKGDNKSLTISKGEVSFERCHSCLRSALWRTDYSLNEVAHSEQVEQFWPCVSCNNFLTVLVHHWALERCE